MPDNTGKLIECLLCDGQYRETWPLARHCPHCGNVDCTMTIYIEDIKEHENAQT
jgi:DNA polymerase II large subunit